MAATVLKALGQVCNCKHFKYQCLVHCSLAKDSDARFYACLSIDGIVLVDQDFLRNGVGDEHCAEIKYDNIQNVTFCEKDDSLFAIQTKSKVVRGIPGKQKTVTTIKSETTSRNLLPEVIYIRTENRRTVLTHIELCYTTAYQFTHLEVPPRPIVSSNAKLKLPRNVVWNQQRNKITSHSTAREQERSESFAGYEYCIPVQYYSVVDSSWQPANTSKMCYVDSTASSQRDSARFVEVTVIDECIVDDAQHTPYSVSYLLDQQIEAITSRVVGYSITTRPVEFRRQVVDGENVKWLCFEAKIRTGESLDSSALAQRFGLREVHIVYLRKSCAPTSLNSCQDVIVTSYSPLQSNSTLNVVEGIVNSISPLCKSETIDKLIYETAADALALTEEQYEWVSTHLELRPQAYSLARLFCASILQLIGSDQLDEALHLSKLNNNLQLGSNILSSPFEYSKMLEEQVPLKAVSNEAIRLWKERVWRYLAWCVDGNMFPGQLSISTLVDAYSSDETNRDLLAQLIDTLLHLREASREFQPRPIVESILNHRLMCNPVYNELVLIPLLESGYISRLLNAQFSNSGVYLNFLLKLLKLSCSTTSHENEMKGLAATRQLHHTLGLQLVQATCDESAITVQNNNSQQDLDTWQTDLFESGVPQLIQFLKCSDSKLQYYSIVSLLNMSRESYTVKAQIIAGASRTLVSLLSSGYEHVRYICALLNTCTKSNPQFRIVLAQYGAVESLLQLVLKKPIEPHRAPVPVIVHACAVLGNLALEANIKIQITTGLGMCVTKVSGQEAEVPRTLLELAMLLQEHVGKTRKESFDETDWTESLKATVVYALKNLAGKDDNNRRIVGRLIIGSLLQVIEEASEDQTILVNLCLTCIGVLAFDSENCERFEQLDGLQVLSRFQQHPQFGQMASRIMHKIYTSVAK